MHPRRSSSQRRVTVAFLIALAFSPALANPPQMNLSTLKQACVTYHDSGEYLADVAAIAREAEAWIEKTSATERAALVLDIDETAITNWDYYKKLSFGFDYPSFHTFCLETRAQALEPTHTLYEHARQRNVNVFFVTGRRETMHAITIDDLHEAGYPVWNDLMMAPAGYHERSISTFKTACRKRITEMGYHIIANVGDQESDLAGGHAEKTFKIPNPFYLVP